MKLQMRWATPNFRCARTKRYNLSPPVNKHTATLAPTYTWRQVIIFLFSTFKKIDHLVKTSIIFTILKFVSIVPKLYSYEYDVNKSQLNNLMRIIKVSNLLLIISSKLVSFYRNINLYQTAGY